MAKKLRVFIHTWHDNELVTLRPGDPAPDWVTNPDALEDDVTETDDETADGSSEETAVTGDDLDALDHAALKDIAGELGIAKKGSADTLRAKIREKRAENAPTGEDVTGDRATLIEKATELGIDVEDGFTDAEIEMLIEQAQGQ